MKAAEKARHRVLAEHFGVLAAVILFTIAAVMLVDPLVTNRISGQVLISLPLFAGLYFGGRDTPLAPLAGVALALACVMGVLAALRVEPWLLAGDAALRAAIVGAVTAWVIREVMAAPQVSLDTIFGAICSYLLIGFVYVNVYLVIEALHPGALRNESGQPLRAIEAGEHPFRAIPSLIYFSYVTLTTVAYGDILPVTPIARFVAMTEGMIGQLYPAIFIARLVSRWQSTPRGS